MNNYRDASGKQYAIRFVIQQQGGKYYVFAGFHSPLLALFRPVEIDPDCITSPEVRRLCLKLSRKPKFQDLLENHLKFISRAKESCFFLPESGRSECLKIVRPDTGVLSFEPAALEESRLTFTPVITFSSKKDTVSLPLLKENVIFPHKGTLMAVLDRKGNRLFTLKGSTAFHDIFEGPVDIERIKRVQESFAARPSSEVTVSFPYTDLDYKVIYPVPIIQIQEHTGGITLQILLKEGETLYSPDFRKTFLSSVSVQETLSIVILDNRTPVHYFNEVKTILNEYVIRERYLPNSFNFSVRMSFEELLIRYGETLLNKGYELHKKGEKIKFKRFTGFRLRFRPGLDWLDFTLKVTSDKNRLKGVDFNPALIEKGFLKAGEEYYLVGKEEIERLKQLYLFGIDKKGHFAVSRYNIFFFDEYMPFIRQKMDEEFLRIKEAVNSLKNFSGIQDSEIPEGFKGTLRPYQKTGFNWLYFLYTAGLNGCLADDMGLGKTVQTLAVLQKSKEEGTLQRAIIVVPVSTLANWEHEITRFTPDLTFHRYAGVNRSPNSIMEFDVTLVSYHTLRNDVLLFQKEDITWLILDEAQAIKNSNTGIFRAVKSISARHKLTLTGTPVENSTLELWSQMDFLMPGLLGENKDFINRFTKPIESGEGENEAEILRRTVKPFILRRRKEDVEKSLPPKEEITLFVDMENDQRELYDSLREYYKDQLRGEKKAGVGVSFFAALMRLRQAAILPSLVSEEYDSVSSCKMELLKGKLADIFAGGHKVLIFSQFIKPLQYIGAYLSEKTIAYSYIDGSTKKRDAEISKFQEDTATAAFLISIKAGGLGINLTAADYVIILDPWWNPAVEMQAVDRAHRIGQEHKVIVYRMITSGSVEEKILKLQEHKRDLVKKLITEEKSFLKSLTKDDIDFIFSR